MIQAAVATVIRSIGIINLHRNPPLSRAARMLGKATGGRTVSAFQHSHRRSWDRHQADRPVPASCTALKRNPATATISSTHPACASSRTSVCQGRRAQHRFHQTCAFRRCGHRSHRARPHSLRGMPFKSTGSRRNTQAPISPSHRTRGRTRGTQQLPPSASHLSPAR